MRLFLQFWMLLFICFIFTCATIWGLQKIWFACSRRFFAILQTSIIFSTVEVTPCKNLFFKDILFAIKEWNYYYIKLNDVISFRHNESQIYAEISVYWRACSIQLNNLVDLLFAMPISFAFSFSFFTPSLSFFASTDHWILINTQDLLSDYMYM